MPALAVTSSSCGIVRPVHSVAFAPAGGGGGTGCPCANTLATFTIRLPHKVSAQTTLCFLKALSPIQSSWILRRDCCACSAALFCFQVFVNSQFVIGFRYASIFAVRRLQLVMHIVRSRI